MERNLLNKDFSVKKKYQSYNYNIYKNNNYEIAPKKLYHLLIRLGITFLTIFIVSIFIKHNKFNEKNNLFLMVTSPDVLELFNCLGFPSNSKEIVYGKLENWGFNLSDIGDIEINKNYKDEDLSTYKYSINTYKNILLSSFEINKVDSLIDKNNLLYMYLEILKKKEIRTFYEFLNTFMILQDLNCLPVNYKGIYINGNLFIPKNEYDIFKSDINIIKEKNAKTLIEEEPYLYLTYHGGKKKNAIHNICKFSRDGYFLGSVLLPFEENGIFFNSISLRGLLLYQNKLYIADSFKDNSKILMFSDSISNLSNRREYLSTFITQNYETNPLMIHPYGIKKYNDYFYVSSQNTGTVLRFNVENGQLGEPIDLYKNTSQGLVIKFNNNDEIRGLDFDSTGKCFVSNKQVGVQIYDTNFKLIKILPVFSPISILFNSTNNHILVGSSTTHDIKEYDVNNFELIKVIKHPLLKHVAGINIYEDSLFVVSQKKNKLLEFSLSSSLLKSITIDGFSDIGERVILSPT